MHYSQTAIRHNIPTDASVHNMTHTVSINLHHSLGVLCIRERVKEKDGPKGVMQEKLLNAISLAELVGGGNGVLRAIGEKDNSSVSLY